MTKTTIEHHSKIKDYIRSGDIYQANMTQRFETQLRDEPISFIKN